MAGGVATCILSQTPINPGQPALAVLLRPSRHDATEMMVPMALPWRGTWYDDGYCLENIAPEPLNHELLAWAGVSDDRSLLERATGGLQAPFVAASNGQTVTLDPVVLAYLDPAMAEIAIALQAPFRRDYGPFSGMTLAEQGDLLLETLAKARDLTDLDLSRFGRYRDFDLVFWCNQVGEHLSPNPFLTALASLGPALLLEDRATASHIVAKLNAFLLLDRGLR